MREKKSLRILTALSWVMFDLTKRRREKFQRDTEFSFGWEAETDVLMEKSSSLSDERV